MVTLRAVDICLKRASYKYHVDRSKHPGKHSFCSNKSTEMQYFTTFNKKTISFSLFLTLFFFLSFSLLFSNFPIFHPIQNWCKAVTLHSTYSIVCLTKSTNSAAHNIITIANKIKLTNEVKRQKITAFYKQTNVKKKKHQRKTKHKYDVDNKRCAKLDNVDLELGQNRDIRAYD